MGRSSLRPRSRSLFSVFYWTCASLLCLACVPFYLTCLEFIRLSPCTFGLGLRARSVIFCRPRWSNCWYLLLFHMLHMLYLLCHMLDMLCYFICSPYFAISYARHTMLFYMLDLVIVLSVYVEGAVLEAARRHHSIVWDSGFRVWTVCREPDVLPQGTLSLVELV